jgi:hypothetical protein
VVVHDLIASVNASYSHAALVSSTLIDAGFNPGTAIQEVPRWTSSASLAYRHSLTDALAVTARADTTYVGSRTDETYSINTLPSYDLTNARAGFEEAPGPFAVILHFESPCTGALPDSAAAFSTCLNM